MIRLHPDRILTWKERNANYVRNLRNEMLDHYGHSCTCCGFSQDIKVMGHYFLQIDHTHGGGRKHLREIGLKAGGMAFWKWLRRNNYPPGYRTLCAGCNASIEPGESKCLLHQK